MKSIEDLRKKIEESDINDRNKHDMLLFDMRNANNGLSVRSREAYMRAWFLFSRYIGNKEFRKMTRDDIDKFFYDFRQGKLSKKNKPLSVASVNLHMVSIKKLYGMLYPNQRGYPKVVQHLRIPPYSEAGISKLQKEDLLTPREIERMVHAVDITQWKALIKVCFESGFRLSELLSMTIDSVNFNENEAVVRINTSKTKLRTVLLIDSLPELKAWMQEHPLNNDPKAPLWYSNRNKVMSTRNVQYILKQAAKKAGINKRVFPHLLRHSIITWRKKMGMVREELCMFAGWSEKTKMDSHYSHFNVDDMLNRQRRQSGLPVNDPEEEKPLKRYEVCPICDKHFPVGYSICDSCSMPLDVDKRLEKMKEFQNQTKLMEQMKAVEPILARILPPLEKIVDGGGLNRLVEILERAANN
jgi:site-specific recombinase XerD